MNNTHTDNQLATSERIETQLRGLALEAGLPNSGRVRHDGYVLLAKLVRMFRKTNSVSRLRWAMLKGNDLDLIHDALTSQKRAATKDGAVWGQHAQNAQLRTMIETMLTDEIKAGA